MKRMTLLMAVGFFSGCSAETDERAGAAALAELRDMTATFAVGPGCDVAEVTTASEGVPSWRIEAVSAGKSMVIALDEASARARRGTEREQDYWYFETQALQAAGRLTWQVAEPSGTTLVFEAIDAQGLQITLADCQ